VPHVQAARDDKVVVVFRNLLTRNRLRTVALVASHVDVARRNLIVPLMSIAHARSNRFVTIKRGS